VIHDTKAILHDRKQTYGSFTDNASIAQAIKTIVHTNVPNNMPLYMLEALDQIASKISRIVCGDPYYKDSWTDISGYAMRVEEALDERDKM
jgi:hypothetical protein